MNPTADSAASTVALDKGTQLAFERTFLAHERTQMAWVRTSLSLISFGFTIAKFFDALKHDPGAPEQLLSPREMGIMMIVSGLLMMIVSDALHRRALVEMSKRYPGMPRSLAGITAILIAALGVLALIGALLRS